MNTTPLRTIDISVRGRDNRPLPGAAIEFLLNGSPAGSIPNSEGHGRIERVSRTDIIEVMARHKGETQRVKLGPNQDSHTFRFDADPDVPGPAAVKPDLIDALAILLMAAALDIFLLAMATQFINSPAFQKLPSFITDAYSALWTSTLAGAAGIGTAIVKAFSRDPNAQRPNYVLYVVWIALGFIAIIVALAFVALMIGQVAPKT